MERKEKSETGIRLEWYEMGREINGHTDRQTDTEDDDDDYKEIYY